MRILFVATIFSPLAARWIEQLADTGWDVHVYAMPRGEIHPLFRNVTIHGQRPRVEIPEQVVYRPAWPFSRGASALKKYFPAVARRLVPEPAEHIARLIRRLKPDLIHSLKMQPEAYRVLEARKLLGGRLPCPWIYSVWGSDIFWNQHVAAHVPRVRQVLSSCDYLIPDNPRDIPLARAHGFAGEVLGVLPVGGGFDIHPMRANGFCEPVSQRRIIAVKGYQLDHAGQALTALEALARCGRIFSGYKIVVHSAIGTYASISFAEVEQKAREVSAQCDVPIEFLPYSPLEAIWQLFGKSRLALAISLSDGTPNAMLEAMIMGAYPIQSDTGGLEGWITHGENGSLVSCTDPDDIARAIQNALADDALVDNAARVNCQLALDRLQRDDVRKQVIEIYAGLYRKHAADTSG